MDNNIVELAAALGIQSKRIILKAQELIRLAEIRTCSGGSTALHLTASCQAVICLDLAAAYEHMSIDKERAIRQSGMRRKVYQVAFQTYERILELQAHVTVKDIALQFGCMDVVDLAQKVLTSYENEMQKRLSASVCEGLDLSQPMFAAAAIGSCCRNMKIKIEKRKLIEVGRAKKSTFDKLCNDMDRHAKKLLEHRQSNKNEKRSKTLIDMVNDNMDVTPAKQPKIRRLDDKPNDDYDEWRKRILEQTDME